ncbi:MAG TPA: arabinan endo-1,5-alpha-L-arabinosidase [Polyangiaceae bacterium]|jgi:arabinan endo-1,5-alpha-L-arabinosidase|nr:arabinan endo-1,5-alpha-L-arabinosidase [Polyangiaceae bacterium]
MPNSLARVSSGLLSLWLASVACSSGPSADSASAGTAGVALGVAGTLAAAGAGPGGSASTGGSADTAGTNAALAGASGRAAGGSGGMAENSAGAAGHGGTSMGVGGAAANTGTGGAFASGGALGGSAGASFTYPAASTEHRAIGTHDPSLIRAASTFYLFATGGLLTVRSSTDLAKWNNSAAIFSALPSWIKDALGQTITDLWAPDVSFVNGTYRVYYSGSTFGSNHSVIGLATNVTLDRQNSAYQWVDHGLVIESNAKGGSKDDWNAIDPNAVTDTAGNGWLVFGSFWSGIKLRRLDNATGMLSSADTKLYSLAAHSGGIEAPSIISHNGYYYLFVSYDACCKGVDSTYRTMVGRASAITGPYTDADGKAMLDGNAVQLLAKSGRYIGPGGGTAFRDGEQYFYAYHYYDGQMNGASELMLRPITWKNDWPELGAPLWQ